MIIHSISLIGKRESNEDQHTIFVNLDGTDNTRNPINLFSVFDGHGGKDISKYLSNNLSEYFTSKYNEFYTQSTNDTKKYIEKVYDHIELKLEKKFKNISYNVGSTASSVIFFKKKNSINYYVVNVGDCRSVLCNNDNMPIQLSKDHKPHMHDEKMRIEKLNGKIYFDGFDWRINDLSVSKSFGDMDALPFVTHKPDIFKYKLKSNDKFIILACDGLWDVISNQDACTFILNLLNTDNKLENIYKHSPKNYAQKLAEHAIENGSTDNVSVIIIFFKNL